eukprot:COSAG02_NODE_482_length_21409_cov_126.131018_14_plen_306_part_00
MGRTCADGRPGEPLPGTEEERERGGAVGQGRPTVAVVGGGGCKARGQVRSFAVASKSRPRGSFFRSCLSLASYVAMWQLIRRAVDSCLPRNDALGWQFAFVFFPSPPQIAGRLGRSRSGADSAETLRARANLARALRKTGIRRPFAAPDSRHLYRSHITEEGRVCAGAGAVGEAWALLEDVLERQAKTQGEGSEDVLQTQQSLASLLIEERAQRRQLGLTIPAEAKPLIDSVVAKKKRALAVELKSQGDTHMASGDARAGDDARAAFVAYTEAAKLYARALELDPDSEELPTKRLKVSMHTVAYR